MQTLKPRARCVWTPIRFICIRARAHKWSSPPTPPPPLLAGTHIRSPGRGLVRGALKRAHARLFYSLIYRLLFRNKCPIKNIHRYGRRCAAHRRASPIWPGASTIHSIYGAPIITHTAADGARSSTHTHLRTAGIFSVRARLSLRVSRAISNITNLTACPRPGHTGSKCFSMLTIYEMRARAHGKIYAHRHTHIHRKKTAA